MAVFTFFSSPNALYTHQDLRIRKLMTSLSEALQRHQPIQLFAIAIAQWSLAHYALIALFLHHEVAAVVSFGKDGGDKRCVLHRQGFRLRIGDVRCPY